MSTREDVSPELERLRAAHTQIRDPDPVLLRTVREHVLGAAECAPELREHEPVPGAARERTGRIAADRAGPPDAPERGAARRRESADRGGIAARDHGGRRRRTRRPLRRLVLAAAATCVLAGVTAVSIDVAPDGSGGGGLPQISAIEQARAALAAPGAIVHYTVTLSRDGGEGHSRDPRFADCNAGPLEVWRATDPMRWRAVQPVSDNPSCGTMDLSQGLGPVVSPRLEVSYANGRTSSYVPGRDIMLVINDEDAPADGERRAPSSATGAASIQLFSTPPVRKPGRDGMPFVDTRPADPVSDVERLLAEGALRDGGESVRHGRRARVLTGSWTRGDGKHVFQTTTVEYVVDAETFAPIAATSTTRMEDSGATASTSAAFAGYERIPLTRDSAKLLEIQPERPPRVVERTIEEIKNPPAEPRRK
jgi:hypothetical protein